MQFLRSRPGPVLSALVLLHLLAACGPEDPEPTTETGTGQLELDAGPTLGGARPGSGRSGAVGSDEDDVGSEGGGGQRKDASSAVFIPCDGACTTSEQCETGQDCIEFAEGGKCAPEECSDCELGCVYDLQTCSFTRCVAEPPPDAPETCGELCETDADCASGQICKDVFGLGECAPVECGPCEGFCDYDQTTCVFDACYIGGGMTDPFYCGHQF